jgi:hypothetical protein
LIRESWKSLTVAVAMYIGHMLVAGFRRSLGGGLAGRLECNLSAWRPETSPISRGESYQDYQGYQRLRSAPMSVNPTSDDCDTMQ